MTQMKLNYWVTASHVALEGFNASAALVNDDIGSFSYLFKERRFSAICLSCRYDFCRYLKSRESTNARNI